MSRELRDELEQLDRAIVEATASLEVLEAEDTAPEAAGRAATLQLQLQALEAQADGLAIRRRALEEEAGALQRRIDAGRATVARRAGVSVAGGFTSDAALPGPRHLENELERNLRAAAGSDAPWSKGKGWFERLIDRWLHNSGRTWK